MGRSRRRCEDSDMKTAISFAAISCLLATPLVAQPLPFQFEDGLLVREFPRHKKQTDRDNVFVEPKEFGEPVGKPFVIHSLSGWKHETDRNAIASGYITISQKGEYRFRTNSYYDRNQLWIDDRIVCHFMDGGSRVKTVQLNSGRFPIRSVGFVEGRGGTQGIEVEWQPPGQKEFSPIPAEKLSHKVEKDPRRETRKREPVEPPKRMVAAKRNLRSDALVIVAKDFVTEIYHNGRRLQRHERRMVLDRFGATAEKAELEVRPGDWLVFHVANNRLRHGGSKYFGVTGLLDGKVAFVSQADSEDWSSCDSPGAVHDFIHFREAGTESRVVEIPKPWFEGGKFMKKYSGHDFAGDAIWGTTSSTWIKYQVPKKQK